jgi:hypothetical protein
MPKLSRIAGPKQQADAITEAITAPSKPKKKQAFLLKDQPGFWPVWMDKPQNHKNKTHNNHPV